MMSTPKSETPILHRQFPGVYRAAADDSEAEVEWWTVVPNDLLPFLMSRVSGTTAMLILALRNCADAHQDYVVAEISDDALAARSGIDPKTIWRIRRDPKFQALVDIEAGVKRSKGSRGKATTYNLSPLMAEFRVWRRLRQLGAHLVEDHFTPVEEARARAKAIAKLSQQTIIEAHTWAHGLPVEAIEAALAKSGDPIRAARALVEEHRPWGVAALDEYLEAA